MADPESNPTTCDRCNGSGYEPGDGEVCSSCGGEGSLPVKGIVSKTYLRVNDVLDKVNDVLDKCNDIFEQVSED